MLPHQGSKRLKRSKVDKRHRSETPMLEDKPTLQLAKLKSHRKHHGEHSSDDLVGGNDSQASKDKDTLLQIASSSSSSQACRSGTLPLLEDTRVGHIFSDMAHISVIKPACLCAFTFSVKIARYNVLQNLKRLVVCR